MTYTPDERCCYCYEGVKHDKKAHDEALWYLTPSGQRAMEKFFEEVNKRKEKQNENTNA